MATPISGVLRFYNLNLRLAPAFNKRPYSSLQKRDIRESCCRHLPTHRFSSTDLADKHVVKLTGLPWRTTPKEVVDYLGHDIPVVGGNAGVYRPMLRNNLPSGHAFVKLLDTDSVQRALTKSKGKLGGRTINVSICSNEELKMVTKLASHDQEKGEDEAVNVICQLVTHGKELSMFPKLTEEDVANFFAKFEIVPNGIMFPNTSTGLSHDSMKVAAYVQFASSTKAKEALLQDGKMIRDCQIGVYRSIHSMVKARRALNPNPRGEFYVHMRNIPATASESDIIEVFSSAGVKPVSVFIFQSAWEPLEIKAFVYFRNQEEVEKALGLRSERKFIEDTPVRVKSRSKSSQTKH